MCAQLVSYRMCVPRLAKTVCVCYFFRLKVVPVLFCKFFPPLEPSVCAASSSCPSLPLLTTTRIHSQFTDTDWLKPITPTLQITIDLLFPNCKLKPWVGSIIPCWVLSLIRCCTQLLQVNFIENHLHRCSVVFLNSKQNQSTIIEARRMSSKTIIKLSRGQELWGYSWRKFMTFHGLMRSKQL